MNYLIPTNTKKSMLIFGVFTPGDLILFGTGLGITILMLMILSPSSLLMAAIDLAPGVITGFLVLPIPNYHNTLVIIRELYTFYTTRQRFIWKGWCAKDEYDESKQIHK
ncbi:MAG TPA: hypothetical protein IAB27_00225 [Candidatus Coprosoma intestinipullorum]|uniref:PrgI family protein n=1 Tax=Candidatus Coprosoma intestinipullorum TaxID=2840752 RepID=A0A9D0ZP51_9FIRM|nr:hypothetical protein [Candidatus Coprosoma intestinipullorum]